MRTGEIVAARLSGGLSLGRYLGDNGSRLRIAIGRNREAKLPADRVLVATGIVAAGHEAVEEFRHQCETLAQGVDLKDLWELLQEEGSRVALEDMAELYWGPAPEAAQKVALLLVLERDRLYFEAEGVLYRPRSAQEVEAELARRRQEEQQAAEARRLAEALAEGTLPEPLTEYQASLLEHLRGYAVHGDNYSRAALVRRFLEQAGGGRDLQRRSFEFLVAVGRMSPDEPLELERADVRRRFPPEALEEAQGLSLEPLLGESWRRDLTQLPTVSIDDPETRDRDDALSVRPTESGYEVWVHIADAGALVPRGGPMDQEADRRMATLYLPEGRIPMLPPRASEGLGSLDPGLTRPALSLAAEVDRDGQVLRWDAFPSVVRSDAALTYEEAEEALGRADHPWHGLLAALREVAEALRERRRRAGAVFLDRRELKVRLEAEGRIDVKVVDPSSPARRMVAELMVLCNGLLAQFCAEAGLPAVYRSQRLPDLSQVTVDSRRLEDLPPGPVRQYYTVRHLAAAELTTTPAPHHGLGLPAYIQVSSPLRRYPDLVLQRQVSHFLRRGKALYPSDEIASVAYRAEVQLRELAQIEEARARYWFLKFLQGLLEQGPVVFHAVVLEAPEGRHALVELVEYPFRVRVEMVGRSEPGDVVALELKGVDLWRRSAQFVHAPHMGRDSSPP